jgi:hypothetical protein
LKNEIKSDKITAFDKLKKQNLLKRLEGDVSTLIEEVKEKESKLKATTTT